MPNEKTDPQNIAAENANLPPDNAEKSGLQLDPEMPDIGSTSSQPTRENMQTQLGAGSELNDSKANSSRVRSNN